jgi:hypothetical protein
MPYDRSALLFELFAEFPVWSRSDFAECSRGALAHGKNAHK